MSAAEHHPIKPRHSALAVVARAWAAGLRPDPPMRPSEWAETNLYVPDGPRTGQRYSLDLTPYARRPLDLLSPDSPCNRVVVRKSAQTGLTTLGIAWIGAQIDRAPTRMMMVLPTVPAAQDFNREKLQPAIDASPALKRKVREPTSRSSRGSTALSKRYPGGSLTITGANSTADLRSKTVRCLVCDEIDEWPADLDGQGDPMAMVDARQISFHADASWKKLEISTPTIANASRIDAAFETGTREYWEVPCPHCGGKQRLEWGGPDFAYGLKFSRTWPYNAHYVCRHCGCTIEHWQKREMVLAGEWVAERPEPGRHPSFHIDALSSLVTTWDNVVESFLKAKDDPVKLKAWTNLTLGQAWEERGEAPDWERLYARRESYPAATIPPGGLFITGGVDVQQGGLYYEIVAWGADRQSWSIDVGYLAGETADPDAPVWRALSEVAGRQYPDALGRRWPIACLAIDSGYNAHQVYLWVRRHANAMATKGVGGWGKPVLATRPTEVDIDFRGKRIKRGALLWPVGTWALKGELYVNLRKLGARDGHEVDPPGYAHFSDQVHDQPYFRQLTAEYLRTRESKGRMVKEWVETGPNHFHDCRIYAAAAAEYMGLSRMSAGDWQALIADRGTPDAPDLTHRWEQMAAHRPSPAPQAPASVPIVAPDAWIERTPDNWV